MRLPAREARNLAPGRFGLFFRAEKCCSGAPEGERIDRKMRERLRTVFRRIDRKVRQGCLASTQRFSALHSLILRDGKRMGPPGAGTKMRGAELCAREMRRAT